MLGNGAGWYSLDGDNYIVVRGVGVRYGDGDEKLVKMVVTGK